MCSPDQYIEAAQVHLSKDEKVDWELVEPTITLMNRTARSLVKILKIGQSNSRGRDRIVKAAITKDTSPPSVSFIWKTHKNYTGV